jgi:hypothetical protein
MDTTRFDALARALARSTTTRRRALLRGATWIGPGLAGIAVTADDVTAKRKRKAKGKPLCKPNGSSCKRKGGSCQKSNCLTAFFSIEAQWTGPNKLYAIYFFIPEGAGYSAPHPMITSTSSFPCSAATSDCEGNIYPFTCIEQAQAGSGPATATVRRLLKGTYEYWIYVINNSPAEALTVTLRDANGQIRRTWSSPENPQGGYMNWHVFDIDGAVGSVKSVNKTSYLGMPSGAHSPLTYACPGGAKP